MKKKPAAEQPTTEPLTVEQWPTARPQPYPKNARRLSDRAVDTLAASIASFGFRQPIVVDAHDVIVVGHTRLLAAQKLGLETVPVHVAAGLTPAQCRAYRLADNRTADETSWDVDLLTAELAELLASGSDLTMTGFDAIEIEVLLRPPPPEDEDTAPPPPKRPVSLMGDIWALGPHRVMCGDATRREDAEKLLASRRPDLAIAALGAEDTDLLADVVFTDPPYNVDYEGYTKERLKIKSDCMPRAQFLAFLTATFQTYKATLKATASMYVCHASVYQREFQDAIEAAGFTVRCQIIWAKNTFGWGFGRYKFQHEPIFYCHGGVRPDSWYGDKTQSTLWAANKPAASRLHPTMKPVELIERALENSSQPGDIVLDLFGGSGSTLIACEKLTRRARLMELDPQYVDVIVARWEQYTGQKATSAADGRTFEDVGAERLHATEKAKEDKAASRRKPKTGVPEGV